jgi:hypothetical protein
MVQMLVDSVVGILKTSALWHNATLNDGMEGSCHGQRAVDGTTSGRYQRWRNWRFNSTQIIPLMLSLLHDSVDDTDDTGCRATRS